MSQREISMGFRGQSGSNHLDGLDCDGELVELETISDLGEGG
ncbi:MAG: hypothetical protein AAF394_07695 [Planctomycetota bacterium]